MDAATSDRSPAAGGPSVPSLSTVRALLEDPRGRAELYYHSFVFPDHKVLYQETPKAACSSIKVGLLALLHRTLEDLGASQRPRKFPEAVVHDREVYPALSLADLDETQLADAITGPNWLRFCVVRDPFSRLYSAWEDKVFLGDPWLLDRFQVLGAHDHVVDGPLDLRATFSAFTEDLALRREIYFEDMHFRPQVGVVHLDAVPFTDIVLLPELNDFLTKLRRHVGRLDSSIDIALPRVNEGLGFSWRRCYSQRAVELVAEVYADDMARFGFAPPQLHDEPLLLDPAARALLTRGRALVRQVAASLNR